MKKPFLKRLAVVSRDCFSWSEIKDRNHDGQNMVKSKARLGKMIIEILHSKETAIHYFLRTVSQGNLYKHRCSKDSVPAVPHKVVAEVSKQEASYSL